MKKHSSMLPGSHAVKKGYNEMNPGQPEGAFPPSSATQPTNKKATKSNAADKKAKEDQS